MKTFITFIFFTCQVPFIFSQEWDNFEFINCIQTICPTVSGVYVGGCFTEASGDPDANYIALWDDCQWNALGPGVNDDVRIIAISGDDVYVGGHFTEPFPYLARWDGSNWHAVGSGPIGPVFEILIDGTNLIVAGSGFVSQWDGTSWETLGTFGGFYQDVVALAKDGNILYACGNFSTADGNPAEQIAMYDGITWASMGEPPYLSYGMNDLLIFNGELYIGGCFVDLGGANHLAKWDGSNWVGLNYTANNGVMSLTEFQGKIFCAALWLPNDFWQYMGAGIYELDVASGDWYQFEDLDDTYNLWTGPLVGDGGNLYIGASDNLLIDNEIYNGIARWGPPDGCLICPALNATGSITNPSCAGSSDGSIDITPPVNGSPPYSYDWSNGATTEDINGLSGINYSLTITDGSSCSSAFSFALSEPPEIVLDIMSQPVSCHGEEDGALTVMPSQGVPGYEYQWSNGENTAFINNLEAGVYFVTVTDFSGCTMTGSAEVEGQSSILLSMSGQDVSCYGVSDGAAAIVTSGGSPGYTYLWSNGSNTESINNVIAGNYTATVTDNTGCTAVGEYIIGSPAELGVVVSVMDVSAPGEDDGMAAAEVIGGTPVYYYLWSTGEVTESISNLTAGNYSLTVTDENECIVEESFIILSPECALSLTLAIDSVTCYGYQNGAAMALHSGGYGDIAFLWSTGDTSQTISNLGAGIYSVTITDANACISLLSDTISEPLAIDVNAVGTNETGSGANDGTAMSNPTGGVPPFNFLWNTGDTLSVLSGLSPGTYTVTITDANGCTSEGTALVNTFGCALDIIPGADLNICEDDTIAIQPTAMGGSGPLSYLWSDGSIGESLSVFQTGEYCVTISDEANCQDLDCVVISEIVIPPFTCPATDESATGANDGAIQCDSLPGIISYTWSNGATTPSIDSLSAGQYCVTVTEQNGCMATQCFYVHPGNCQMAVNVFLSDILCHGDSTGSILLITDNGTAPITYTWSNGGTTNEIENLSAGNYAVTVSDASGCVELYSFTISEPDSLTVVVNSLIPVGVSESGLLGISVSGGSPPYTYQWTYPSGEINNTEDLNNLTEHGPYSLMLLDDNGCILHYVNMTVAVNPSPLYESIKVYPVPAKDVLIIDTEKLVSEVWILGVDGRVVKHIIQLESNRLDIADLGPGWYILRIRIGNTLYMARAVK